VQSSSPPEKKRATLIGLVAKGNDVVKFFSGKLIYRLGPVMGHIDSYFPHNGDRYGVDGGGICSGGKSLYFSRQIMIRQPFGHLAAGTVPGTDE
jgi:hypothetical protein